MDCQTQFDLAKGAQAGARSIIHNFSITPVASWSEPESA